MLDAACFESLLWKLLRRVAISLGSFVRWVAWTAGLLRGGTKAYSLLESRVAHIDEGILGKIANVDLK